MAEITAALVKELREKTGVGMMDCKKALGETSGDLEAAVDWLRAKGLSKAAKKADRAAAEGLVGVAVSGNKGAIIEFNSETDFVARNEGFQKAAAQFASTALAAKGDHDKLLSAPGAGGTVSDQITQLISTIGENMTLRRSSYVEVSEGVVAPYVHSQVADGLGRIGVLVALESKGKTDVLMDVAKKVAMHVAATGPLALADSEVPAEAVARERAVYEEQVKEDPKMVGKPENVLKGVVEGRLRKFFEEVVLTKQKFVMAPDQTVEAWVKAAEKDAGAPIKIAAFRYFRLGEGVEKPKDDFAAEVAGMTGKS
ncbi:MAG: elongation factor Ts [Hyphomonadaceae bacterium]|nr:MAG: elongation factor T [Caulobacteraceae bacterium]MBT9445060.1 elongation factor Ts [Hyphomonadaceae bacterium]TPW08933.1 MAG: elongation factor T [Alphaproteobacteria bacterium]